MEEEVYVWVGDHVCEAFARRDGPQLNRWELLRLVCADGLMRQI